MCIELFSLRDKVALVTGAGKGLGRSMAIALAESGAHVAVVSRTLTDVESTAKEIQEIGKSNFLSSIKKIYEGYCRISPKKRS